MTSCRAVGERLAVPMPSPRVELRMGEAKDAVESEEAAHVIHMRHWNRALFKRAALIGLYARSQIPDRARVVL